MIRDVEKTWRGAKTPGPCHIEWAVQKARKVAEVKAWKEAKEVKTYKKEEEMVRVSEKDFRMKFWLEDITLLVSCWEFLGCGSQTKEGYQYLFRKWDRIMVF